MASRALPPKALPPVGFPLVSVQPGKDGNESEKGFRLLTVESRISKVVGKLTPQAAGSVDLFSQSHK